MNKQDVRKLHPQAQEAIRLRIARFLKYRKGTHREAADIFQVSLRAVEKIWKQYKEGAEKALQAKKRGPGHSTALLSQRQVKEITRALEKGTPDNYGLSASLWTAGAVRLLIKKKRSKL